MLEDLTASEILPDPREFTYLNDLLDQWLQLSGTVDTDIPSYPVWRGVTELVADLEPSNTRLWSNRVQPLLQLLQNPDYSPPRGIRIREPSFQHLPIPPYQPHLVPHDEMYATPARHPAAARAPDEDPRT